MRIGMAKPALTHLLRPLLANRHIPQTLRLPLFQSLVVSKLFFGLGAWHTPTPKQLQRLTGFYVRALKTVMRWPAERLTPKCWLRQRPGCSLSTCTDCLLYARRVFTLGPCFLQNVLLWEDTILHDSWTRGLRAGLRWMHEVNPAVIPAIWADDLTLLIEQWQHKRFAWKAMVKAVAKKHQLQEAMMAEVVALHRDVFDLLKDAGATFRLDPFAGIVDAGTHACHCGNSFATRRGLLAHQRRKHHIFSIERQFLQGAICLHCGRFCWTTQRLQQHLAYIPKKLGYNPCFQALSSQGREVDYELARLPKQVVGLARREYLQTHGPQVAQETLLSKQRRVWELELAQCLSQLEIDACPPFAMERGEQIGDALTAATMSWFKDNFPHGPSSASKQELIDTTFGENNPE